MNGPHNVAASLEFILDTDWAEDKDDQAREIDSNVASESGGGGL